ncbi:response regulator transcription factor [Vallitalea okinawensis]|uniref:response regulator transcription factor n=1 Tax=Vallitalea okinawensis TaxID=2078660 RepID=UPI001478FD4A|nr:response regulator [Vallitalea okinawensis]
MYNLLIIDDNPIIRKSLIARINNIRKDFHIIGEASNGKEAIKIINAESVDIIITDIRMPEMDGLTLLKKIRLVDENIQFIVISGYDNFEYTKQALIYNVVNYLLKPINDSELLNALQKAKSNILTIKKIQQQEEIIKELNYSQTFEKKSKEFVAFYNDRMNFHQLMELPFWYDYLNTYSSFQVVAIYSKLINRIEDCFKLQTMLEKSTTLKNTQIIYYDKSIAFAIIGYEYYSVEQLNTFLELFKHEDYEHAYRLSISEIVNQPLMIKKIIGSSIHQLHYHLIKPTTQVIYYQEFEEDIETLNTMHPMLDQLRLTLNLGLYEESISHYKSILKKCLDSTDTIKLLIFFQRSLIHHMSEIVIEKRIKEKIIPEYLYRRYALLHYSQLSEWSEQMLKIIQSLSLEIQKKKASVNHQSIIQYINIHYNKSLSLSELGQIFDMNANYIGQLIKKETGLTFKNYLHQFRINQAKKMLVSEPDKKLEKVSYELGYRDLQYFSNTFKKLTGMSPSQYRKEN